MQLAPGSKPSSDIKINVAFIGSCTSSRISDLRAAATEIARGRQVSPRRPGLCGARLPCRSESPGHGRKGLDKIFTEAGFEWRAAGCSMCLAMNPDQLKGDQISASSSNRNFIGRQGSPTGRTLLMSPAMVAAAAIKGHVTDVRRFSAQLGV